MKNVIYKIVERAQRSRLLKAEATGTSTASFGQVFRRGLLVALLLLGVASFVEVVLFPGSLVRRHWTPIGEGTVAVQDDLDSATPHHPWFTSQEEKNRLEDLRRRRVENRTLGAHARLESAIAVTESSYTSVLEDVRRRLGVDLASEKPETPVAALSLILAGEPTAEPAWSHMRRRLEEAQATLREARSLHALTAQRFAAKECLPEDERELLAVVDRLERVPPSLGRVRADVNHLDFLQRARAALARPNVEAVSDTGGQP